MDLPDYVANVLAALERAGYESWVVGGCVRDALLGREPKDYDVCTAALPEQTKAVFAGQRLILAGERHGTVGVITPGGVVEITTFRHDGGYADCRHPDSVCFVPRLEEDLQRRDFTVNAMAWSPERGLRDPFGGREDLEKRVLRTVGAPEARFREDALRILRGARFCAVYGLEPEEATFRAMLSERPLLDQLARERVYGELCGFLPAAGLEDLLRFAPLMAQAVPELAPTLGFDQHSPHHAYDLYTHIAHVTAAVPPEPVLRWAALLHDIGKVPTFTRDETGRGHFYGHAAVGAEMAREALHRLHAPNALTEEAAVLIEEHMHRLLPEKKALRRLVSRLGYDTACRELALQEADMGGKGTGEPEDGAVFAAVRRILDEIRTENDALSLKDLAINGNDLKALGLEGRQIGQALSTALDAVLDERVANEESALLAFVRANRQGSEQV